VHNLRRSNPDLGFCEALRITFLSPSEVPDMFLSSMEKVERSSGRSAGDAEFMMDEKEHVSAPTGNDENVLSYPSVSTPSFGLSRAGLSNAAPFEMVDVSAEEDKPAPRSPTRTRTPSGESFGDNDLSLSDA